MSDSVGSRYEGVEGVYFLEMGELIGRGGFSTIRQVAVAVFIRENEVRELPVLDSVSLLLNEQDRTSEDENDARLLEEARRVQMLMRDWEHPNVIQVFDVFNETRPGYFGLLMEERGQDLKQYMNTTRATFRSSKERNQALFSFMEQTASAVDYVHRQGVVHRDIKPTNITVVETPNGPHLTLIDFSCSVGKREDGGRDRYIPVGNRFYKPPWLRDGDRRVNLSNRNLPVHEGEDVFGLGMTWVVLHKWAMNQLAVLDYQGAGGFDPARLLRKELDACGSHRSVIRRLITPYDEHRLTNGGEVVTALDQYADYRKIAAAIDRAGWIRLESLEHPAPIVYMPDLEVDEVVFKERGLRHVLHLRRADGSRHDWTVNWQEGVPNYAQFFDWAQQQIDQPLPGILSVEERQEELVVDGRETLASIKKTDLAAVGEEGYLIFERMKPRRCCWLNCGTVAYPEPQYVLLAHRPQYQPSIGERNDPPLYAYDLRPAPDGWRLGENSDRPGLSIQEIAADLGAAPAPGNSETTDSGNQGSSQQYFA